ncbi:MAG: MFS transporter, partial [Alphaproteobacteria bacterium]|nr:MFS transporter [Alphaproteobacteria bacterium]
RDYPPPFLKPPLHTAGVLLWYRGRSMTTDKNIKLLNLYTAFANMIFLLPVLLPMYRDRMGLGFGDFLIAESAFAATVVLLEVPSGWLSDIWHRRHTLMLGLALGALGFFALCFAYNLLTAIGCHIILGAGFSLLSGTQNAILYDTLLSAGREDEYTKYEGRRRAYAFGAVAASSLVAGFMFKIHILLPAIMTGIAHLFGIVALAFVDEPARHKAAPEKHPLADMRDTMRYALTHPEIGGMVIFAALLFTCTKIIMWSQQAYYMVLNIPEQAFGVLMAVGYGLASVATWSAHKVDKIMSPRGAVMTAWGIAVFVTIGAGGYIGLHGVILLMVGGSCIYGFASPHVETFVNKRTGSERRATVLSTISFATQLMYVPASIAIGHIDKWAGVHAVLLSLTALLVLAGGVFFLLRQRARQGTFR